MYNRMGKDFLIISPQWGYTLSEKAGLEYWIGPYIGMKLDAKAKFFPEEEFVEYNNEGQNTIDSGLNMGLRKNMQMGGVGLHIEPRFQLGLTRYSFSKQISFQVLLGLDF